MYSIDFAKLMIWAIREYEDAEPIIFARKLNHKHLNITVQTNSFSNMIEYIGKHANRLWDIRVLIFP